MSHLNELYSLVMSFLRPGFPAFSLFIAISQPCICDDKGFKSLRKSPPQMAQSPEAVAESLEDVVSPMDFTIEGSDSDEQNPLDTQMVTRERLFHRMRELHRILAKIMPNGSNPNYWKTDDVLRALNDEAEHATGTTKADLHRMLIASLVESPHQTIIDEVPVGKQGTALTWSYRRLSAKRENWGPLFEVQPGKVLFIPVLNLLNRRDLQDRTVPEFPIPDNIPSGTGGTSTENAPQDFDIINLHTHGLNVSPDWPSDDIFRQIKPGQLKFFIYAIPKNHPPGTFFYHPHNHGSVATQVSGGMAGMLIIRDQSKGLDALGIKKGWSGRNDIPMLVQQMSFYGLDKETGDVFARPDFFALKDRGVWATDIAWLKSLTGARAPIAKLASLLLGENAKYKYLSQRDVETWVNGKQSPRAIAAAPGEAFRLRIVHAGVEENLDLILREKMSKTELTFQVIARDGIPLKVPYNRERDTKLILSPGNRSDILVKVPPAGTHSGKVDYELSTLTGQGKYVVLTSFNVDFSQPAKAGELIFQTEADGIWADPGCVPNIKIAPTVEKDFVIGFKDAQVDQDGNFAAGTFQLNGQPFPGTPMVYTLDSVATLNLSTAEGAGDHPLHIHVNPFLVPEAATAEETKVRLEHGLPKCEFWTDTLYVNETIPMTVQMQFENWTGRFVSHCHILDHEDGGMMNIIRVDPPPTKFPILPIPEVVNFATMPSGMLEQIKQVWPKENHAVADSSNMATLYVFMPKKPDGYCPHCAESVKAVAKIRSELGDLPLRIIAITNASGEQLPSANALGLRELDVLCSDPHLESFKSIGLIDSAPEIKDGEVTFPYAFDKHDKLIHDTDLMHGLFVVSPQGHVVSARRGFLAFDESQQIIEEIKLSLLPTDVFENHLKTAIEGEPSRQQTLMLRRSLRNLQTFKRNR